MPGLQGVFLLVLVLILLAGSLINKAAKVQEGLDLSRWKGVYPAATDQETCFNHDLLQITASFKEFLMLSQILKALLYLRTT